MVVASPDVKPELEHCVNEHKTNIDVARQQLQQRVWFTRFTLLNLIADNDNNLSFPVVNSVRTIKRLTGNEFSFFSHEEQDDTDKPARRV